MLVYVPLIDVISFLPDVVGGLFWSGEPYHIYYNVQTGNGSSILDNQLNYTKIYPLTVSYLLN